MAKRETWEKFPKQEGQEILSNKSEDVLFFCEFTAAAVQLFKGQFQPWLSRRKLGFPIADLMIWQILHF